METDFQLEVKPAFESYYREILGDSYDAFMECNQKYLRRAIRMNPLKADPNWVRSRLEKAGWKLTPVPWCADAYWIEGERRDVGNLLEHQLGYFYIQDPASMLPPLVLDPQPGETVLDMCASPGSKTSQVAAMMNNEGIIVANELQGSRLPPLGVNLQKLGVTNAFVVKHDGRRYKRFASQFDRVMIDAPCSGTGTIRRSPKAITMFNPRTVKSLAGLQKQLLEAGWQALKPGGVLTYSTCSIDPLENEQVVSAFLDAHGDAALEDIDLAIEREPVMGSGLHPSIGKCLRIHPQTNDTEGFFVCKLRKKL